MCCSTGVCGPSVDPELIRISSAVHHLKTKGIDISRFNLASEPDAFVSNQVINKLLAEKGTDVLPVVIVDDQIVQEKGDPTNGELSLWTGIPEDELTKKPKDILRLPCLNDKTSSHVIGPCLDGTGVFFVSKPFLGGVGFRNPV
ncbi:arsenical resistance operon transcriptional repressor ArsD [Paenibacillus chitinolyticus]|uniref:Arsenical resistance operon transcriptional repressor ArsD n=1 Tax=Paenibacillus chitinolyticus TaxID=79263 RepID=A0A410WXS3_9BACL|nr:arsenical resistance operon transcriptional repressor ArsD [Paenibacillus chitinolyticus]